MEAAEGGSLLIAWQLKNKNVLIVGGGKVAAQRIASILTTDGHITLISPSSGLSARTKTYIDSHPQRINYHDRFFQGREDLADMDMVLTALDDPQRSREIWELCRGARIPINAADLPDMCDFYFGAQIRDGPLQIMISTNGNGPRVAALIRDKIKGALSGNEGKAIEKIGRLRVLLKERASGIGGEIGGKRMRWMSSVCEEWSLEDFIMLDEPLLEKLLDSGWEEDRVPTFEELTGRKRVEGGCLPLRASVMSGIAVGVACLLGFMWSRHR
ncbi:hypothetical protein AX16_008787 [Volvariella volvacea WC 439]|nr:hypothetical protein AX16_008787 [Volvariella volvacea WC 439]